MSGHASEICCQFLQLLFILRETVSGNKSRLTTFMSSVDGLSFRPTCQSPTRIYPFTAELRLINLVSHTHKGFEIESMRAKFVTWMTRRRMRSSRMKSSSHQE